METTKEFAFRKSQANQGYIVSAIMLVGVFIIFAITERFMLMPLIFGFMFLIIAGLNGNLKIVKIFSNHFELKKGAISSSTLIKNQDFIGYEIKGKTAHIFYMSEKGYKKTFKLHERALEKEDFPELIRFMDSLATKNKENLLEGSSEQ